MRLVGYVVGVSDEAEAWARFTALREGLAARGWIKHRNFEIVARFGTADQFECTAMSRNSSRSCRM